MNLTVRIPAKRLVPAPPKPVSAPKASVRRVEERRVTRAREQLVSGWLRSLSGP